MLKSWPVGYSKAQPDFHRHKVLVLACRPQKHPHGLRISSRLSWGPCLGMATPGMQPLALPPRQLVPPSAQRGHLQSCLRKRSSEAKL